LASVLLALMKAGVVFGLAHHGQKSRLIAAEVNFSP